MKKWKRYLSLFLAAALIMSFAGCKKTETSKTKTEEKEKLASIQGVFAMQTFDDLQCSETSNIMSIQKTNDRIYILLNEFDKDWNASYSVISMNMDGSDQKKTSLEVETVERVTQEDSEARTYENIYYGSFHLEGDQIYAMKNHYLETNEDENYNYTQNTSVVCFGSDGKLIWETPVEMLSATDKMYYVNSMIMLSSGNVGLLIGGDSKGLVEVFPDGRVSDIKALPKLDKIFDTLCSTNTTPDGKLVFTYYTEDYSSQNIVTYDMESDTLNAPFPLPSSNYMNQMSVDESGDLYYTTNEGVFKYHIGDAEPSLIMSFFNSDLLTTYLDAFLPINDEKLIAFYTEYDYTTYEGRIKGGLFTKVDPKDIPDKKVLTLGGMYIPMEVRNRMVDFNKTNSEYRMAMKDYSTYITPEDYNAGQTQLNNDIIAGNMPDIMILNSGEFDPSKYVSKGLLADVGELMQNDPEISKIEYNQNVFDAYKINGKLYHVIPSYHVRTYIAKKSLVGERNSITFEEAEKILATMPEGASMFEDLTRSYFMEVMMSVRGNDFVDVTTGKCKFDSDDFIAMMEFAKTLPENNESYEGDIGFEGVARTEPAEYNYSEYELRFRNNKVLFCDTYISSLKNMIYTINGRIGEDVSYVGFPTASGQGATITADVSYVLAAKSKNINVAWDFVKYYLTDEYQDTLEWTFPVAKKQFEAACLEATKKERYKNYETGVEEERDYTYYIADEEIVIPPLTNAQKDEACNYVLSINTKGFENREVLNIINEEMEGFFLDQKSAKEVAGIIQSRVQLYVNENR